MEANFDGIRKVATENVNSLHDVIVAIVDNGNLFDNEIEDIIEAYNNAANSIEFMNMMYDDETDDDMNDLSDELTVFKLRQKKECPSCGNVRDIDDFMSDNLCESCYEYEEEN